MDLNKFSTFNIILAIVFIIYALIIFLLFSPVFMNFKISFIFTIIAFILQYLLMRHFNNEINESTQITAFSAFFVADVYLVLQIIISIIFNIINLNFIFSIIIQAVILGIFIIIELLLMQSIDYIDSVGVKKENQIKFQKTALKHVEIFKKKYPDCKELENLYETVRYSNPISNDEVNGLENNILNNMNRLEDFLSQNDKDKALNTIKSIIDDFNERNIILTNKF